MESKKEIILRLLGASLEPLTSRELFNGLEPPEQGLFSGGVNGVSKTLYTLRSKGLIVNDETKIVNGQDQFTWSAVRPIEQSSTEPTASASLDDLIAEELKQDQQVELAIGITLNPNDYFEEAMIVIVEAIREFNSSPAPLRIKRKQEKLDLLKRLGALMSDDIKAVMDDIAADLFYLDHGI